MRRSLQAWVAGIIGLLGPLFATQAAAQEPRVASVELVAGHAGFVDDAWDHRRVLGGIAHFRVTPRITVGPEVVYLRGSDGAHDLTVTGVARFDLRAASRDARIVPYVVVGAGLLRQTTQVGGGPGSTGLVPYSTSEGTVSGGAGARIAVGRRWFIAPEFRMGLEPETRLTVNVGWR